ncbi:hypothetical protein Ahy_B02g059908 isoform B [Arachis hypogaea]|uniref:Uncharacterized protein n=1 Tax=Arachis hypogaea TaxID=3818 RepID=A0A445AHK8_ARAHY|nr:hypothetical protein Ahy_B02g059908 isoform B [Arachis hypogaea]
MAWCFFLAGKAFCESHSRAMAVVVAVIARGGGYRGGGGGGGSCNNCGYSGLLQGTAQQAFAEKYLHSMLILMLQKLEFLSDLVVQPDVIESQSDEQRHNLYSRFYISGRDFAAFFTDYGSDFGSCSLVKPTHDSQIISSPWAKEADNVYSVIDRCGMAVLVNQNHGNAEHIAKTMETCNQPTPDSLHSKLAPWSRDLVVDGRILVWKGIGNSVATWQTCFLVLSGSYLYVFETAESQSYQRYLRAWIIGSGNGEDRIAPLLVLSSSFKK